MYGQNGENGHRTTLAFTKAFVYVSLRHCNQIPGRSVMGQRLTWVHGFEVSPQLLGPMYLVRRTSWLKEHVVWVAVYITTDKKQSGWKNLGTRYPKSSPSSGPTSSSQVSSRASSHNRTIGWGPSP